MNLLAISIVIREENSITMDHSEVMFTSQEPSQLSMDFVGTNESQEMIEFFVIIF